MSEVSLSRVNNEVVKLLSYGSKVPEKELSDLKKRIGSDEYALVLRDFEEQVSDRVAAAASRLAHVFYTNPKLAGKVTPDQVYALMAEKYANNPEKYGLKGIDVDTFNNKFMSAFKNTYKSLLAGTYQYNQLIDPKTKRQKELQKIFGFSHKFMGQGRIHSDSLSDADKSALSKIVGEYNNAENMSLENKIFQQLMYYSEKRYMDLDFRARTESMYEMHDPNVFISPVLALLFIPKIESLDERILKSSYGRIVTTLTGKSPVPMMSTSSDFRLLNAWMNDPNEPNCFGNADLFTKNTTVMTDVYNRSHLQTIVKDSVYNIRNGSFYGGKTCRNDLFTEALDCCKVNPYENPGVLAKRDEITILKRLLNSFSYYTAVACGQYAHSSTPAYEPMTVIPVKKNSSQRYDIKGSLSSKQQYLVDSRIVDMESTIVPVENVLFFYLDRKKSVLDIPKSSASFFINAAIESLNVSSTIDESEIEEDIDTMNINGVEFVLKGGLIYELHDNKVVGSTALLNLGGNNDEKEALIEPYGKFAAYCPVNYAYNPLKMSSPLVDVDYTDFKSLLKSRGFILMYVRKKSVNKEDVVFGGM
jgi:hypothetical protein